MTGGSTRRLVFGLVAMTAIAVEVSSRLLRGPGVLDSLLSNTFTQFAWAGSLLMYGLSEVRTAERARGLRIAAAVAVVIAGVNALDAARRAVGDGAGAPLDRRHRLRASCRGGAAAGAGGGAVG